MSKLGVAAATMGVGGTGAAGTYTAYSLGAFGGGSGLSVDGFANPLHKKIVSDGRQYQPLAVPLNEATLTSSNSNKFSFNNWDCINKLFPEFKGKIKHEDVANGSATPTQVRLSQTHDFPTGYNYDQPSKPLYLDIPTSTKNLVACGQFDWRGGNNIKEKIHFRSEVVVKDENYGWVMWNGLSSNPSSTPNKVDFEYRLLTFKKENNGGWKIDKGFGWSSSSSTGSSAEDQLYVALPTKQKQSWQIINDQAGDYSTRQTWSGVAKIDNSYESHVIQSLKIYMRNSSTAHSDDDDYNAEFFGLDSGKWVSQSRGYNKANKMYVDDKGWQTITTPLDLKESLTAWYMPFKGKSEDERGVSWMTCEQWVSGSAANTQGWESTMRDMCYSQPASR